MMLALLLSSNKGILNRRWRDRAEGDGQNELVAHTQEVLTVGASHIAGELGMLVMPFSLLLNRVVGGRSEI